MKLIESIINVIQLNKALKLYGNYYSEHRKSIRSLLYYYTKIKNYNIAIWGAGLKGKAFLRVMDSNQQFIKYVYDIDEKKFGKGMPTGHKVVDFTKKANQDVKAVFLMNNTFETETASELAEHNMNVILINVDSMIAGNLSAKDIIKINERN